MNECTMEPMMTYLIKVAWPIIERALPFHLANLDIILSATGYNTNRLGLPLNKRIPQKENGNFRIYILTKDNKFSIRDREIEEPE